MIKSKKEQEIFIKNHYYTCENCGYNNEKNRFMFFGCCLRCGKKLSKKTDFLFNMKKAFEKVKREE